MNTTNVEKKPRKPRKQVSARAKTQAVLAVWSGRRSASQVCRELGVNWGSLHGWEHKGIQGILKALGGETPSASAPRELGKRLEGLLAGLAAPIRPVPPAETGVDQG
jgi:transposase-like protein